jgi:hypothetical protein
MQSRNMSGRVVGLILGVLALSACATAPVVSDKKADEKVTPAVVENKPAEVENKEMGVKPVVDNSEVAFNTPQKLDTEVILAKYKGAMIKAAEGAVYQSQDPVDWKAQVASYYDFYDIGEIKIAPYQGQRLLMLDLRIEGMGSSPSIHRLAWDSKTGQLTWLPNLSDNNVYTYEHFDVIRKNLDKKFTVKTLESPKFITLPDGKNVAELQQWGMGIRLGIEATDNKYGYPVLGEIAFNDAKLGSVYFSESVGGCLYTISIDGIISSYGYDPGLLDEKNGQIMKFADGSITAFNTEYSQLVHGCGIGMSCYYIEEVKAADLVEIGRTNKGISIFEAKDRKQILVKDTGTDADLDKFAPYRATMPATVELNQAYENYKSMNNFLTEAEKQGKPAVMTYDKFLATHPVLYWKDPFGRFAGIIRNDVKPAAECGKPVIYLYPEKTSKVSVKVGIDEFTKTEPAYGNGWEVMAEPSGKLTNLADGQNYPYLFWEGISKKQLSMDSGFVIAKKDLAKFLDESLVKLGLNEQESKDFREFWEPKMQAAQGKYLLISFVGTREFNKIAPLDISPKPDTLIRVFMYYQPLAKPIKIAPQKLSALERKGFTVFEWGGTSSDGWQTK